MTEEPHNATEQCVPKGPPGGNPKVDLRHRIPSDRRRAKGWGSLPLTPGIEAWSCGDPNFQLYTLLFSL